MGQMAKSVAIYRCDYPGCDRRFAASGHLARHRRVHTGERRFICPYEGCGGRFSRKDNMMQHYRTHYGIRVRRPKKTAEEMADEDYDRELEQRRKQIVDAMAVEATARMKIVEQQRELMHHQQHSRYPSYDRSATSSVGPSPAHGYGKATFEHHRRSASDSISVTQRPFSMLRFRDLITKDSYETRDGRVQKRERDLQQLIPIHSSIERCDTSSSIESDYSSAFSRGTAVHGHAGATPEQTPQLLPSSSLFTRRDMTTRSVSRSPIMAPRRFSPYESFSVSPQNTPLMQQRHDIHSEYTSPVAKTSATSYAYANKYEHTVRSTVPIAAPLPQRHHLQQQHHTRSLPSPSNSPTLLHRLPLPHPMGMMQHPAISTDVLPVHSKRHIMFLPRPDSADPFFNHSSTTSTPVSPITRPSSVGSLSNNERITLPPLRQLTLSSPSSSTSTTPITVRLPSMAQTL